MPRNDINLDNKFVTQFELESIVFDNAVSFCSLLFVSISCKNTGTKSGKQSSGCPPVLSDHRIKFIRQQLAIVKHRGNTNALADWIPNACITMR